MSDEQAKSSLSSHASVSSARSVSQCSLLPVKKHPVGHLGAGVAGTFGLVGSRGNFVRLLAGRFADRHGSRWVIAAGMALLAFSYVVLWAQELAHVSTIVHMIALAFGVIVLDVGAQMCQVANQTRIPAWCLPLVAA